MDYLRIADRAWPLLNRLFEGHTLIYRASGGRIGHRLPFLPPVLLLDHVGRRSGTPRTTALIYVPDGENLVLVASKGGFEKNPGWFHNLMANPDTTVQVGSRRKAVRARRAAPDERARLWPRAVRTWRSYHAYQRRTRRQIPLVVLEPRQP